MLIEFRVSNYLSFKDEMTLSMVAARIKEHNETHVFPVAKKYKLLKGALVFGANASGKSNLLNAMAFARTLILKSYTLKSSKETQVEEGIDVTNFKLSVETETQPSMFEFLFIHEGIRYRYGFVVDRTRVHKEWLYYVPKAREVELFIRQQDDFEIGTHFKKEGKKLVPLTRANALFLSVLAQFNGEISGKILGWFTKLKKLSGLNDRSMGYTIEKLKDTAFKDKVSGFLKRADIGIDELIVQEKEMSFKDFPSFKDLPVGFKFPRPSMKEDDKFIHVVLNSIHKKLDGEGKYVASEAFNFAQEESEGTKKLFALSGPILDSLEKGNVLVIDEIDARLHPRLTQYLVGLFNSKETNPNNAQLIAVTNDTNLLNKDFLRRDQIWFTEKNKLGATSLYSLIDYQIKIRNDASFEKDYLSGKYGAVPIIRSKLYSFPRM